MTDIALLALAIIAALIIGLFVTGLIQRVHPILILIGVGAFVSEADLTRLVGIQLNFLIEIAMLGLMALAAIPGSLWLWFRWRSSISSAFACLLLLPILGLLTTPWSAMPDRSVIGSTSLAITLILVYYASDRFGTDQVVKAVVLALIALVAGSIVWDVLGPGPPPNEATGVIPTGFGGLVRWQGLTDQQNQLGRTAAMCTVLCMVHARQWPTLWVATGVTLGSVALLGSQSKTSLAAVILVACILAWRRDRLELVAATAAVPGIALLTAVLMGSNPFAAASNEVDSGELLTATGRTTAWLTTLDLAAAEPLLGHGAFASLAVLQNEMRVGRIGYDIVDPHNTVLTILLTQGVVGVSLLIGSVILFARSPLRKTKRGSDMSVVLLALCIISLAENVLWKANTTVMLMAICFATVAAGQAAKTSDNSLLMPRG